MGRAQGCTNLWGDSHSGLRRLPSRLHAEGCGTRSTCDRFQGPGPPGECFAGLIRPCPWDLHWTLRTLRCEEGAPLRCEQEPQTRQACVLLCQKGRAGAGSKLSHQPSPANRSGGSPLGPVRAEGGLDSQQEWKAPEGPSWDAQSSSSAHAPGFVRGPERAGHSPVITQGVSGRA